MRLDQADFEQNQYEQNIQSAQPKPGDTVVRPLSSEDAIREATVRVAEVSATTEAPYGELSRPVQSEPAPAPLPRRYTITLVLFLLFASAQTLLFGSLIPSALQALDTSRLVILLSSILLTLASIVSVIKLYRFHRAALGSKGVVVFSILSIVPVVAYALSFCLMLLGIATQSLTLVLVTAQGYLLAIFLAPVLLLVAAIALGVYAYKRTGFRRIMYLWPLLIPFLAGILTVPLVGDSKGEHVGVVEQGQLNDAKKDLSTYLSDRYGIQFDIKTIKFNKELDLINKSKAIVAEVSPKTNPQFTYTASMYVSQSVEYSQDSSKAELSQRTKYSEDFLGAYWMGTYKDIVCPQIRSIQDVLKVATCDVTNYSLDEDYLKVLARYRGAIPAYSDLSDAQKKAINFGVSTETIDDDYINNLQQHAAFIEMIRETVQTTGSTGSIAYYSTDSTNKGPFLGYSGTTDLSTPGGKIPAMSILFEQDVKDVRGKPMQPKRYYNASTGVFDVARP